MSEIILLDGSMGQELVNRHRIRHGTEPNALWGTRVMLDAPDMLAELHSDYIRAGAKVVTLNSYALLPDRLERFGLEARLPELISAAGRAAISARGTSDVAIAGSLGPLGWSYRPDLTWPEDEAAETYARVAALQAPYVDLFIVETASSFGQARGALKGALTTGKPVWVSVTADDADGSKLRSGEPVSGLADALADLPCAALLVNCSVPEAVGAAITALPRDHRPVGGYANGFRAIESEFVVQGASVGALHHRHDLSPEKYAAFALGWVDAGASIVGGCCEVGPAHIAYLHDRLSAAGHQIRGPSL